MGTSVVHFAAKHRSADAVVHRELLSTSVAWMGAAGIAVLPVYLLVSHSILTLREHATGVTPAAAHTIFWLGALLVACLGLRVFPSALQGYGFLVYQRFTQSLAVMLRVAGTLYACLVLHSLVAVAVTETFALLTPPLLCALQLRRKGLAHGSLRDVSKARLSEMVRYAARAFLLGAMALVLLQADALIVGVVISAAAVSYYSVASRVYGAVLQAIGWMTDPLLALLSRLYTTDADQARQMFIGMLFATLWFACGACGSLILASPGLVPLWLGHDVPAAQISWSLAILLAGLIISSTHEAAIPASDATGRPGAFASLYVWWAASNVLLSVVGGVLFGIAGVALGTTVPLIVLEPFFLRRIQGRLGVPWRTWVSSCMQPIMAILGLATVSGGSTVLVARYVIPTNDAWVVGAGVFALCYAAFTALRHRTIPLRSLRLTLRARL
jgi:O-antigen/teichoic acid export membrane protein